MIYDDKWTLLLDHNKSAWMNSPERTMVGWARGPGSPKEGGLDHPLNRLRIQESPSETVKSVKRIQSEWLLLQKG